MEWATTTNGTHARFARILERIEEDEMAARLSWMRLVPSSVTLMTIEASV